MILRHRDPYIPTEKDEDPFSNCKLERKQYANVLTQIISNYADGFVLAINNPWGEGKTTFVKMWKQKLSNEGYETLYYNAWENDFEGDVLVALISELGEIKNKPISTFNKVVEKVVPLTAKLLPLIGKHLSKKAIGDEATEAIIEGALEYGSNELKEEIETYISKKKSIEDFKESLEVFVSEVGKEKSVVFIIDELDRCRPDYAVEVLEQIKHLFSVPGIVFVLSIDKIQLGHAVRGVYGSEQIDANEYLRRFIDVEYSIPKPKMQLLCSYLYDYFNFDFYFKNQQRSRQYIEDGKEFIYLSVILFEKANLSIRQIEKIYANSRLILTTTPFQSGVFPKLHLLLIFLKNIHPDIYEDIKNKVFDVQTLINRVENLIPHIESSDRDTTAFLFMIAKLANSYHNYYYEDIYPFVEIIDRRDNEEFFLYKSKFEGNKSNRSLIAAYNSLNYKYLLRSVNIKNIIKKIDLLDPVVVQ